MHPPRLATLSASASSSAASRAERVTDAYTARLRLRGPHPRARQHGRVLALREPAAANSDYVRRHTPLAANPLP